jgi:hypothetical protein
MDPLCESACALARGLLWDKTGIQVGEEWLRQCVLHLADKHGKRRLPTGSNSSNVQKDWLHSEVLNLFLKFDLYETCLVPGIGGIPPDLGVRARVEVVIRVSSLSSVLL